MVCLFDSYAKCVISGWIYTYFANLCPSFTQNVQSVVRLANYVEKSIWIDLVLNFYCQVTLTSKGPFFGPGSSLSKAHIWSRKHCNNNKYWYISIYIIHLHIWYNFIVWMAVLSLTCYSHWTLCLCQSAFSKMYKVCMLYVKYMSYE